MEWGQVHSTQHKMAIPISIVKNINANYEQVLSVLKV